MSLLKEYKSSLKLIETEEVVELVFFRPLAFLFVKLIYNTGLTPNQVTFLGLIFGVSGGVSLAYGTPKSMIIAAFLFIIFCVLDCSDGQLARLKGNGTQFGRIFDGMADYLVSIATYTGMIIAYAVNSLTPWSNALLILMAALSNIVHAVLVDYYRNRFIDYARGGKSVLNDEMSNLQLEYEELKNKKGKIFEKIVLRIYLKYSSLQNNLVSTAGNKSKISSKEYYKVNKLQIHLWTYLGPTTQWSFLIICLFFDSIHFYLWTLITVFNIYAFGLFFVQKSRNRLLDLN